MRTNDKRLYSADVLFTERRSTIILRILKSIRNSIFFPRVAKKFAGTPMNRTPPPCMRYVRNITRFTRRTSIGCVIKRTRIIELKMTCTDPT